jgi:hypothetical protein
VDAARASAVTSGGPTVLDLLAGGSLVAVAAGTRSARPKIAGAHLARALLALGAAAPALYLLAARPRFRRWGASDAEVGRAMPGDRVVRAAGGVTSSTQAISIDAPPERVWPWLVQMGVGRGGFYTLTWVEHLLGLGVANADCIVPDLQHLGLGDVVGIRSKDDGARVAVLDPGRCLVLVDEPTPGYVSTWDLCLSPLERGRTRLVLRRGGTEPNAFGKAFNALMEPGFYIMDRGMLRGIKERAERATGAPPLLDRVLPGYDFRGRASAEIHAPPAAIFRALREVTLADMPLADALGSLRYLPGRLTGRLRRRPEDRARPFFDVAGNPVLAEAPEQEVVVGCVGRLHNLLDQQFVDLDGLAAFARFATPGYEKLAMSFRVASGDAQRGYRLECEHRTLALGAGARRAFALYWWLLIRWGSAVMLRLLFAAVRRRAEASAPPRAS